MCYCNTLWNSILPPPPCPYHSAQAYNGICACRGSHAPHPFHRESITTGGQMVPIEEYFGKHRAPEKPTP